VSEISDIMSTNVVTVVPDTTILEATNVLTKHDITGLPVVDRKKRLLGIISRKDLLGKGERDRIARMGRKPAHPTDSVKLSIH